MAKVVVSANPEFKRDDLVVGLISWGEYELVKGGAMIRRLDPMGFPLSYHVGILGNCICLTVESYKATKMLNFVLHK